MPKNKTLKPTNQYKARREKLALQIAQTRDAIEGQRETLRRLNENIERWTRQAKWLGYTLMIAQVHEAQLLEEFNKG